MLKLKCCKSLIVAFFILFLFNKAILAQKLDDSSKLINLYKEYRLVQQKKTIWVDTIDNWTGKYHKIMSMVADTLGKQIYRKKDIINLLGKPDMIINRNTQKSTAEIYALINKKPINKISRKEEYLLYKWRGYRDFIYFYIKGNVVQQSEWYYSWE